MQLKYNFYPIPTIFPAIQIALNQTLFWFDSTLIQRKTAEKYVDDLNAGDVDLWLSVALPGICGRGIYIARFRYVEPVSFINVKREAVLFVGSQKLIPRRQTVSQTVV
jgi:hypothetical protein